MTAPTLIELPELEQGTDEWHDQRRGIVTASVVGKLVTSKTLKPASNDESRGLTRLLTAERITGWTDPTFVSDDMMRGIEDEPKARAKYAEHYNVTVRETGFMIRDDNGVKIGYSPDGLVGDDGLIEAKSRRQKKHLETILSGHPPIENMAQMQCGLLVSERKWCDYISYCGGMPMWISRVYPDQRWFDAILAAVDAFEASSAEMIRLYMESIAGFPMTERTFTEMEFE
ncbi:lambda exonuclease family protein [Rhodococcus sp. KB6]|uniref:lambda exonuclease family protein n=1 Tax=Rhodococcus sp. KB6 TaxID=1752066 RepID=UPI000717F195|nr:lambda exonuclease family protein [Rhodococcus sp. KB6]